MSIDWKDSAAAQPTDSAGMPVPTPSRQGGHVARKIRAWREQSEQAFRRPRSFSNVLRTAGKTPFDRAIAWLLPWGRYEYPGRTVAVRELTGVESRHTVYSQRSGQTPTPAVVLRRFAAIIEDRAHQGLAIASQLLAEADAMERRRTKQGRPDGRLTGFCQIGSDGMSARDRHNWARQGRAAARALAARKPQ